MEKYPHIQFKKHWQIRSSCAYQLGECSALIQALSNIPLKPGYRKRLLLVSLIKGAQATTAIEGNTLTETEIEQLQEGWKLPASREYQAIVTHVYLEWIHPFGDGNGRTGRLLEFYILLRAGLPNIVSHVLSNFYNNTRSEYYRQLIQAKEKNDLTYFIEYAVQGFRDGLSDNLKTIQESQFDIFWHDYIYETFAEIKYTKKEAFKRKRQLILQMPPDKAYTIDELTEITPEIAKKYAKVTKTTVSRDLKELCDIKLLIKKGRKYKANIEILKPMIPLKIYK